MKIAFLLTQLEIGGAQVRVFQTAEELRKRGHLVDVLFLYQKREAFADQPKIILSNRTGAKSLLGAAIALYRKLNKENYQLIITNTAPANIIGNGVAALAGLKSRMSVQTQPPQRLNSVYRLIDKIWGSLGIYRYNVANSEWTATCFESYPASYKRRLHVLVNGIKANVSPLSRLEARKVLGLPLEPQIILNVGRLSVQKDQRTVISAIKSIPNVLLVIVGAGELQEDLSSHARSEGVLDRVILLGEISRSEVGHAFRAADVFAFPSRWETFGLAVVEAAASGLPIVATNLAVLEEVLRTENGQPAALFAAPGDVASFASAIERILQQKSLADELSELSLAAARHHSIEAHVDRIEDAFIEITGVKTQSANDRAA